MNRLRAGLAASLAASAVAGCLSLPMLPAGGRSAMSVESDQFRRALEISPAPLASAPVYRPLTGCSYRIATRTSSGRWLERRQETSIREVRDRLLITITEGRAVSTALIGRNGEVFDFTVTNPDGSQTTTESFLRADPKNDITINPINLAFPHYNRPVLDVGQSVALVQHHSGWPWGYYVYRGTTTYRGREAAVLDLTTWSGPTGGGDWLTVGFSLIDVQTGMPLLYALDAGFNIRVEQLTCR